jgi:hypothetical protein
VEAKEGRSGGEGAVLEEGEDARVEMGFEGLEGERVTVSASRSGWVGGAAEGKSYDESRDE